MNINKRKELIKKIAYSDEPLYIPVHIQDLITKIYEYKKNENRNIDANEISEKFNISLEKAIEIDGFFKKYLK